MIKMKSDLFIGNIEGKNLFNVHQLNDFTQSLQYFNLKLKPNTTYTMSTSYVTDTVHNYANLFFYRLGDSASTGENGVWINNPKTLTTDSTGNVVIAYRDANAEYINEKDNYWYMIEEKSTATDYMPFQPFIVESGNNSNGSWIKYSDGTLKQWFTRVCKSNETIDLPVSFNAVNYSLSITCGYSSSADTVGTYGNKTISSFKLFFTINGSYNDTSNQAVDVIAIGRWK